MFSGRDGGVGGALVSGGFGGAVASVIAVSDAGEVVESVTG